MIHQCHRCELRFLTESEMIAHVADDHGEDTAVYERYRYPAGRDRVPPLYPAAGEETAEAGGRRRYLVVANQTLGGEALTDRVRGYVEEQPAFVYVLVPATHSADYAAHSSALGSAASGGPERTDEQGLEEARRRVRWAVETFRQLGAEAAGEVGPPDPFAAVAAVLDRERFDEVIVSTLPTGVSRWLGADLLKWVERRYRVPVTTVVVSHPQNPLRS